MYACVRVYCSRPASKHNFILGREKQRIFTLLQFSRPYYVKRSPPPQTLLCSLAVPPPTVLRFIVVAENYIRDFDIDTRKPPMLQCLKHQQTVVRIWFEHLLEEVNELRGAELFKALREGDKQYRFLDVLQFGVQLDVLQSLGKIAARHRICLRQVVNHWTPEFVVVLSNR